MIDRGVVSEKLAELSDRLARVSHHRPSNVEALKADRDRRDLVAFNLMLAVQSCADLASHIIADESWEPASTVGGAFERLSEHGVIDAETAAALKRAVGLRNVVAHGYAGVDLIRLYHAATSGVDDVERFA